MHTVIIKLIAMVKQQAVEVTHYHMIIIWFDSISLNFKTKTTYKVGWSCECVGFSTSSLAVAENCRWKSIDSHLDQSGNRNGDHKDNSENYLDNTGVMPVLPKQKML